MAHKRKTVRASDVKQGMTVWCVIGMIVTGQDQTVNHDRMQRYRDHPEVWYSQGQWAQAHLTKPYRIFVANGHCFAMNHDTHPLTKVFFRENDAWDWYNLINPHIEAARKAARK